MDKNRDYEVYYELHRQAFHQDNLRPQRKILLTRIYKLSAKRSKDLYIEIGNISFKSGQFQKALVQFKRATIINPISYWTHFGLAKAYLGFEKENEAFSCLKKALFLSPTGIPSYQSYIIKILKERGKFNDLDSFYEDTANMFTDDAKSIANLYYGSAEALVSLNEYPKALEVYKKVFENHQMSFDFYSDYAFALYHEGLFEEAIVQFEHALEKNPGIRFVINNIAFIRYCLGRLQKAFEEFEEIITNGLVTDGTYSNFILVLYHMGKDEEVINHYRDLFQQNLGENGPALQSMYEEALRITQAILERDNIDEQTREFNNKKIQGINLVLSFIN